MIKMDIQQYLKELTLCKDTKRLEDHFGIYFDNFPILIRSSNHNNTFKQILDDIGKANHLNKYFLNERIQLMSGKKAFGLKGEEKAFGFLSPHNNPILDDIIGFEHNLYLMFQKPLSMNVSDEDSVIATTKMVLDFSRYLLEKQNVAACLGTYNSQDPDIQKGILINTS